MTANGLPRILICCQQPGALAEMRQLLSGSGCEVVGHSLEMPDPERPSSYHLIVLENSPSSVALELCRRLREHLGSDLVPLLFVGSDGDSSARLAFLDAGANAYLARPFTAAEFLAQVKALLRLKDAHDRLTGKTTEINRLNKRLQQLHRQNAQELELARRIQSRFIPTCLPELPGCRFAVQRLSRSRAGGDFHDVFRLDDNHIGLYVADVMGHGTAASLLAILVNETVKTYQAIGQPPRPASPSEVLQRLNTELVCLELPEHPFLTMVYVVYNPHAATLRLARSGNPYPLFVPRKGAPSFWRPEGLLLGVGNAAFTDRCYSLQVGDKLLLYSDGIDTGRFQHEQTGEASLLVCATVHRHLPIHDFIERLARNLFADGQPSDDVTLLGLERTD